MGREQPARRSQHYASVGIKGPTRQRGAPPPSSEFDSSACNKPMAKPTQAPSIPRRGTTRRLPHPSATEEKLKDMHAAGVIGPSLRQGLWWFHYMLFGLCNAPATLERLMERVVRDIPRLRCVVYLDGLLVHGEKFSNPIAN